MRPAGHEQDDRQRNLHEHEGVLRAVLPATRARACGGRHAQLHGGPPLPSVPANFTTGRSPKSRAERSDTASENARTRGSIEISESRGSVAGPIETRRSESRVREPDRQGASQQGEREAFDEQVTRDVTPARAQGRAHRELMTSALGPHEQQVGDVGARDHAGRCRWSPSAATAPARRRRSRPA